MIDVRDVYGSETCAKRDGAFSQIGSPKIAGTGESHNEHPTEEYRKVRTLCDPQQRPAYSRDCMSEDPNLAEVPAPVALSRRLFVICTAVE